MAVWLESSPSVEMGASSTPGRCARQFHFSGFASFCLMFILRYFYDVRASKKKEQHSSNIFSHHLSGLRVESHSSNCTHVKLMEGEKEERCAQYTRKSRISIQFRSCVRNISPRRSKVTFLAVHLARPSASFVFS